MNKWISCYFPVMERGELGGWILRKGPGKVDDDKGGHGSFLQTMINTLAAASPRPPFEIVCVCVRWQ